MRHPARTLCLMVGLAATLLSPAAPGLAQGSGGVALYQESFDGGQATGWQLEPGWQVVQDGNNAVLAGEGHHWARPGVSFRGDFSVQFRLKLLRGRIYLVYRTNDAGRYFIGFQEDKSDLSKQYWRPDTFQNGLAGSKTAHSLGTWHQIEIAGRGATLRFLVDDQLEWEYTDPDPLAGDSFAFETLDDSQAYVDDIRVYGPPSTPQSPPAHPISSPTDVHIPTPAGTSTPKPGICGGAAGLPLVLGGMLRSKRRRARGCPPVERYKTLRGPE